MPGAGRDHQRGGEELARVRKQLREVTEERGHSGAGRGFLRQGDPMTTPGAVFVEAEKQAGRNVAKACELLGVSRSAYLRLARPSPVRRRRRDAELTERIARDPPASRAAPTGRLGSTPS